MSHNSSLAVEKTPTEDIPSIEIPDEGDGDLVEKKTYSIVNVFGDPSISPDPSNLPEIEPPKDPEGPENSRKKNLFDKLKSLLPAQP